MQTTALLTTRAPYRPEFARYGSGVVASVGRRRARVGLFETSSDVDNCIARVGAQIRSLDADARAEYVRRYGPEMFAATITAAQLEQFKIDRAFYKSWREFTSTWDDYVKAWQERWVSVLSADKFRDCMNYDSEQKAWREKFASQGISVTAPATTTPSILPGVVPSGSVGNVLSIGFGLVAIVVAGIVLVKVL